MKTLSSLLAMASSIFASPYGAQRARPPSKLGDDPKFIDFAANFNKDIRDLDDFVRKQDNFRRSDEIISAVNRRAQRSGKRDPLKLGHNWTSDLDRDEYLDLLGLDQSKAEQKRTTLEKGVRKSKNQPVDEFTTRSKRNTNRSGRGRNLIARAMDVDHYADGNMFEVKQQGYCGSCWAFAATTALEGTLAIKTGKEPFRLSEQQSVDCTTNTAINKEMFGKTYGTGGCGGGWMGYAWNFMRDHGVMVYEDYPYTGRNADPCKHNSRKVVGKVLKYDQIVDSVEGMKDRLVRQPLTAALDASSYAFQYYRSGVITAADDCGEHLNHAVVIVGFTDSESGTYEGGELPGSEQQAEEESEILCQVTKWFS